jgi:hypothetical protein
MNGNNQQPVLKNGSPSVTELYQHVVSETKSANGGTRFVVRAVKFENSDNPYVAISRLWYKADINQWLPTSRGHIFLPIAVWKALAANVAQISINIDQSVSDGLPGCGVDSERVAEPDASGRVILSAANTGAGSSSFYGSDATCYAVSEQQQRSKATRKAQTNAYAGGDAHASGADGSSTKRGKFEH